MKKNLIISTLLVILFLGGLTFGTAWGQDKGGKPVIHESFAGKEISPYETWKIYLKVSDPDGNMRSIFAVVDQAGVGQYPLGITRLKKGKEKEFLGYLYLNSIGSNPSLLNFAHLNLTLWVKDRSGNFSDPVSFPLSYNVRFAQESPPQGKFQEDDLGPIMIHLVPVSNSARLWLNE